MLCFTAVHSSGVSLRSSWSRAYRLLEHEETKLWHASPAQIYDEYLKQLRRTNRSYHNGPHHSKLAPYSTLIREWRDKEMTIREIVEELWKYSCRTTAQSFSLILRNRHTTLA